MSRKHLTSESVKSLSLSLESVDDIHGGDSLSAGMLGVGDSISDDILKEHLEDSTGLFVDQTGDSLDTTSARKTTDGRLSDSLDVVSEHLAMTLSATLSQTLSSFSSARHDVKLN